MKLDTIGKNIRKFRLARKLRQEDLAEKTDLTTNYIGMVERGEKIPSLETFIKIVNALGVSSDMVLTDVLENAKSLQKCSNMCDSGLYTCEAVKANTSIKHRSSS